MSEHSESRASRRSGFGNEGTGAADEGQQDPNKNPFSIPPDDLIFEFKDKEKLRKV